MRAHRVPAPGHRILAAVSGGGDSVALLRLLLLLGKEFPLTIAVAHVNHRLRGEASDQDQRFVQDLCARLGLSCRVVAPDDDALAALNAGGEAGLRSFRHERLRQTAREIGASHIALGHTLDDQAETLLMRLLRGGGRRGLSAMRCVGPDPLIRPMLHITREQARGFLREIGQDFREDETNTDDRFLRNRVRSRLLPVMVGFNPRIVRSLAGAAELLGEEDRYLDSLAADWIARHARPHQGGEPRLVLPAAAPDGIATLVQPLAARIVRIAMKKTGSDPRGVSRRAIQAILGLAAAGVDGSTRPVAGGVEATIRGADLIIGPGAPPPVKPEPFILSLPIPGEVEAVALAGRIEATVLPRDQAGPVGGVEWDPMTARLDASLLGPVATVRNRRPGDAFHPLGAPGRRKLGDFLIDIKIPRAKREHLPLVIGPAGIAWVVGHRVGHPYRVTDATERVAILTYRLRVDRGPF